ESELGQFGDGLLELLERRHEHLELIALVDATELSALREPDDDLGGLLDLVLVGVAAQVTAPAHVDDESIAAVELRHEQQITTHHLGDLGALEQLGELLLA